MGWIDTFVHAFSQSEVHHTGDLVCAAITNHVLDKPDPGLLIEMGKNVFIAGVSFAKASAGSILSRNC